MGDRVRNIRLTGDASINFARSIYAPTHEQLEEFLRRNEYLDSNVHICDTDNGYQAEIEDLDLSFLNNSVKVYAYVIDRPSGAFEDFEINSDLVAYDASSDVNYESADCMDDLAFAA